MIIIIISIIPLCVQALQRCHIVGRYVPLTTGGNSGQRSRDPPVWTGLVQNLELIPRAEAQVFGSARGVIPQSRVHAPRGPRGRRGQSAIQHLSLPVPDYHRAPVLGLSRLLTETRARRKAARDHSISQLRQMERHLSRNHGSAIIHRLTANKQTGD